MSNLDLRPGRPTMVNPERERKGMEIIDSSQSIEKLILRNYEKKTEDFSKGL